MKQPHMRFFQLAPTFSVVAVRTGRNHIIPMMLTPQVFGKNVINR
jgi:hypothetical protein